MRGYGNVESNDLHICLEWPKPAKRKGLSGVAGSWAPAVAPPAFRRVRPRVRLLKERCTTRGRCGASDLTILKELQVTVRAAARNRSIRGSYLNTRHATSS